MSKDICNPRRVRQREVDSQNSLAGSSAKKANSRYKEETLKGGEFKVKVKSYWVRNSQHPPRASTNVYMDTWSCSHTHAQTHILHMYSSPSPSFSLSPSLTPCSYSCLRLSLSFSLLTQKLYFFPFILGKIL